MGPQLNRCGNVGIDTLNRNQPGGFNGAATKPLRKPRLRRDPELADLWLQWGRN